MQYMQQFQIFIKIQQDVFPRRHLVIKSQAT